MFQEKNIQLLRAGDNLSKIKILACDDDPVFLATFVDYLKQCTPKDCQAEIHGYTDPAELTDTDLATYDIIFLDIDMGSFNGLALAKHIRNIESEAILIFVTNYIEYSPEGYEVQAFRFLMKGQLKEKLPTYFADAVNALKEHSSKLTFSINGEPVAIKHSDLIYLESEGRKIHPHITNRNNTDFYFYSSMDQLEIQLKPSGFMRIHKSFLVNIDYVLSFHYNKVVLTNGVALPVSERRYSTLRKQYLNWKLYHN